MKKLKKVLLFMLAVFSVVSCKKYLEEKADKSLVVPATLSDLQALLDDSYYMNLVKTSSMPESSADDYFLTMDNYNNNDDNSRATYNWTLKEYFYSNDWSDAYVPVYNANVCLETIAGIPRTNANNAAWDNVKGSALFYRSYYYLNLVWEFAIAYDKNTAASDRGIVMRTGTDFNVRSFRSSVADSYTKIINDARDAVDFLPDQPLNVLRPSKAAAYGLLTRAFLSMREYDSAYKYSNLFLQARNVLLNYNTININAAVPFPRFDNPETVFYTEMNGNSGLHGTFQAFIDTTLISTYKTDDLRTKAFFIANSGYQSFKGNYTKNKYTFFTGIATDEILLSRAECLARKDLVTEAMNDLNKLLIKRWNAAVPFIPEGAINKDDALNKILLERRKELLMRGLRWIDIKRLNKEGRNIIPTRIIDNVTFSLPVNDPRYALPIPADIIRITGIEQN